MDIVDDSHAFSENQSNAKVTATFHADDSHHYLTPSHMDVSSPHKSFLDLDAPMIDSTMENDEDRDFEDQVSPLEMPPSQIDGLESLQADDYSGGRGRFRRSSESSSPLHLQIPGLLSPADIALSAMQCLPYPLIILNNLKTSVLCNEAMGRLLGIEDQEDAASDDGSPALDKLKGQTLSQLGVDMLQNSQLVWVTWESFLDELANDASSRINDGAQKQGSESSEGDVTPTAKRAEPPFSRRQRPSKEVIHDCVVEVVISHLLISNSQFATKSLKNKRTYMTLGLRVPSRDTVGIFNVKRRIMLSTWRNNMLTRTRLPCQDDYIHF